MLIFGNERRFRVFIWYSYRVGALGLRNVRDLGKLIVAKGFKKLAKVQ